MDDTISSLLVCYLDYDGCLHDDAVYVSRDLGIHIRTPGRALFEWSPILSGLLAPYPAVKIVLSTSWVRARGLEFARQQLLPELQPRVIGATFDRRLIRPGWFDRLSRGQQILRDVQRRKPAKWFAIDNDSDGPEQYRDRLVKTDDRLGLSEPRVQDAIRSMLMTLSQPGEADG